MSNLPTVKPLSANEAAVYVKLQQTIKENIDSFVRVGVALAEIRDRALYREEFGTFERYVRTVWDMARRSAYQLIEASGVVEFVRNCAHDEWVPANEAQARALAPIIKQRPSGMEEMLALLVETAPKGGITAAHVKKTARQFLGSDAEVKVRKARKPAPISTVVNFQTAFDAFMTEIAIARRTDYEGTDREAVIGALQTALAALEQDDDERGLPENLRQAIANRKLQLAAKGEANAA